MPIQSVRYQFREPLDAPARDAFDWCVDFRASDAALFPGPRARTIQRLSDDALLLTDTTYPNGRRRRTRRLVRINAREMAWTNTHVDGPFRHSQFWYRVVPDGPRRSHLEFQGLMLIPGPQALSRPALARAAQTERAADAALWHRALAPALARDLHPTRADPPSPSRRPPKSR